jgi:hypothetical protein
MNAVLVLLFMLNGQPKEVQLPVSMAACMTGAGVQVTASEYLRDHPGATYDPRTGWKCRIGAGPNDAAPIQKGA